MSALPPAPTPATAPPPESIPSAPARALSWHGIRTVMVLEMRQRIRSTRWKVALAAFFVLVGVVTLLLRSTMAGFNADENQYVFELILLFVLGLGLLLTPTLASTSINGDRNAGTLAIMQVTKLSPADLALGKLLAGWLASLAFLAVSSPFLIWTWAEGTTGAIAFVRGVLVLALLLAVVCAFSLGFSAITARPAGSSVLSYLTVGTLTVICLILFGLSVPMVSEEREVQVYTMPVSGSSTDECVWETRVQTVVHTDRTWWLLVVNPFVVLADAAGDGPSQGFAGPLDAIRQGVQLAREGAADEIDHCWGVPGPDAPEQVEPSQTPFWPWGLGLNLLLGAGGLAVAIRRLAVPYRKLPKGARVA